MVTQMIAAASMDANLVTQMITAVGFPIVACLAMAYYVKYITDKNREDIQKMTESHREEINEVTQALNNNTLAIQQLVTLIDAKNVA